MLLPIVESACLIDSLNYENAVPKGLYRLSTTYHVIA